MNKLRFFCLTAVWVQGCFLSVALGEKSDIKYLTPNIYGSTGLFTVPVAETLRQGEFAVGFSSYRFNRDPGALELTVAPFAISVGLHDRVEFFTSFEGYKRTEGRDVLVGKMQNGGGLLPAYVASVNRIGYSNDGPFLDVSQGEGIGDLWTGAKINVLTERGIGCLSLAVQPMARFSLSSDRKAKLKGLTSGTMDAGFDLIASKVIGRRGSLSGKLGFFSGTDVEGVGRQEQFSWGAGLEWPLIRRSFRILGELTGITFIGRKDSSLVNAVSPLDANVGARIYAASWLTISGALNIHLKNTSRGHPDIIASNRFGWIFQISLQRKINRPPVIVCRAGRSRVLEGETVTVVARLSDPDDDAVWLSWKSNGGRLTEQGRSVLLETSGMDPGRYSVMAEVGDERSVASCSVDITVEKRD